MARQIVRFDRLTLPELMDVRRKVEDAISNRVATERKELQARLDELSRVSSGETQSKRQPRAKREGKRTRKQHPLKGRKASPKYEGPDGQTWSGRGLAPRWLVELEKKGKKRESFLIRS